jgi:hypothetical protein
MLALMSGFNTLPLSTDGLGGINIVITPEYCVSVKLLALAITVQ